MNLDVPPFEPGSELTPEEIPVARAWFEERAAVSRSQLEHLDEVAAELAETDRQFRELDAEDPLEGIREFLPPEEREPKPSPIPAALDEFMAKMAAQEGAIRQQYYGIWAAANEGIAYIDANGRMPERRQKAAD